MIRLVSELTGTDLALWVARAQKLNVVRDGDQSNGLWIVYFPNGFCSSFGEHGYRPDLNWEHGGPLIEKYEIGFGILQGIAPKDETDIVRWRCCGWHARVLAGADGGPRKEGATPLIAAMRALVASVYGKNVPDEVAP
ncbi:phage protein NinX family protein [Duganella guangzhouensis]|uniref:phage protein NinX family protein n=1 Tax=Duganella guangzhouensis TaxID=2666084 RepID=UPI0018A1F764|nr:phage protein NinX family protein [Duganella guangzhouensis]